MPDQTAEKIVQLAQEPVNNLVVVMAIISIIAVIVAVVGIGFLVWKFAPVIFKQIQQQIENNKQQTQINEQQAAILERLTSHSEKSEQTAEDNKLELVKQTSALNKIIDITQVQNIDFKAYQTLVSDNMANHSSQVAANTEKIGILNEKFDTISANIELLSNQIRAILEDKVACASIEETLRTLKDEFTRFVAEQSKRGTGTFPIVPNGEGSTS